MTRDEFLEWIRREPFAPFRVVHKGGLTAEILRPRSVLMMLSHVAISDQRRDHPNRNSHGHVDWYYADMVEAVELPQDSVPTGVYWSSDQWALR